MLLAAGYAPVYRERRLDHPDLAPARAAVDLVLKAYEPYLAIAVDRGWNLVSANAAAAPFLALVRDPALLQEPINVLRLSLHQEGLGAVDRQLRRMGPRYPPPGGGAARGKR